MKKQLLYGFTVLTLVLAAFGNTAQPAAASAPAQDIGRDTLFVPGEVVVGFDEGLQPAQYSAMAQALAGTVGAQVVDQYASAALLSFEPAADVESLAAQIGDQSGVRFAQPNYISWIPEENPSGSEYNVETVRMVLQSNGDGRLPSGGSIEQQRLVSDLIKMRTVKKASVFPGDGWENWGWYWSGAWKIWSDKSPAFGVCELDTGIDGKHPDLKGKVLVGYDFVNDDKKPDDDNGHGTHVAGTMVAIPNNAKGLAGISNGKVVAVKVLNAQGWGTSFDIFSGIVYCANRSDVRVLNMSLGGGYPDEAEWYALDYALNYKGKLLAAAAGNSSEDTSVSPLFPSAWANPGEYPNGTGLSGSWGTNIAQAVLSVGATTPYWNWVDVNGDSVDDDDEYFWDECAAYFSNWGEYVEIVAPGEDIFSSTPVSYPFYDGYLYGVPAGYDWFSGTSMATPHVAAAAARVWGLFKLQSNADIKDQLLYWGDPVETVEDLNLDGDEYGYWDDDYTGDYPFCWPDSMGGSVHLNVALAMGRTAIAGPVTDAQTGLPLVGTTATIKNWFTNAAVPTAKVGMVDSFNNRWYEVLNVPVDIIPDEEDNYDVSWYGMWLNKAGYTAGPQRVGWVAAMWDCRWCESWNPALNTSIPPNVAGRYTVVADWDYGDYDLHVFLPAGTPGGGVDVFDVAGTLRDYPWARWYRESAADWVGAEAVSIHKLGKTLHYGASGNYQVFVNDYGGDDLFTDYWTSPFVRLWDAGKMLQMEYPDPSCSSGDTVWYAFNLGNPLVTRTLVDTCGGAGLYPYAAADTIQGIPEEGGTNK